MKDYYVYEHSLDGEVFYVGTGSVKTRRAYQLTPGRRNKLWNDFVKERKNEIKVNIVEYFDDYLEAERYEQQLTAQYHKNGLCKCNLAEGKAKFGKLNGMYGKERVLSEEAKKKISAANSGENNGMYGKPSPNRGKSLSLETRLKMSKSLSKKIICLTDGKVFNSRKEAQEYYGHQIPTACIKHNVSCKGKKFKYVEDK